MIDLCPRCRIQAPHRPGREQCPRCGGPLRVLDSDLISGTGGGGRPPATPVPSMRPRGGAPAGGPRSGGIYRNRHVRWVARRPPEAIPAPRPPQPTPAPGIPRYLYIPSWGLQDAVTTPDAQLDRTTVLRAALDLALRWLMYALLAQAVMQTIRYVVVVVNRSAPIPGWLASASAVLVIFTGILAVGAFVYATVVFVRWLMAVRGDAYRGRGLIDPRRRWVVAALAAVPLVNVIGAPLLIREVVDLRDDLDAERTRARLVKVWVAWVIVNALAVAAIVVRILAANSGSIQTAANGLVAAIVSTAVSALFAWWLARRLGVIFAGADHDPVPDHRWVVVAS